MTKRAKKNCFFIGIVFIIAAVIILIGGSTILSSAKETDTPDQIRHYISYEVQSGDTLWSIADQYCEKADMDVRSYMNELREINSMKSDLVVSGTNLMVMIFAP